MSQSPAPRWLIGATAVLLVIVALTYAFYTVFSRPLSLDEGFLMITVQSFLDGQPLYDSLFTQYGPVYYWYEWIVHRGLAIELTHDATRFLCIFHWVVAAILLGFAGGVMTRSAFAGLFVFAQAVAHLAALANEPGHPQELVAVLLALGLLVAASSLGSAPRFVTLAVLGTSLFFIKINIGVFFFLALFLTMYWQVCSPGFSRVERHTKFGPCQGGLKPGLQTQRLASALLIAGCAVLPFLLMRRYVMYEWCRNYALLVAATSVAASITAKALLVRSPGFSLPIDGSKCDVSPDRLKPELRTIVVAAGAVSAVVCAAIAMLTGTSLRGLIDGMVLTPLRLADAAVWPLTASTFTLLSAAASLVLAAVVSVNLHSLATSISRIITLFKALFGVAVAIILVGESHAQLKYLLPWVWLVVVPNCKLEIENFQFLISSNVFARVFLCFMTVWQALQAYPIAGTQVAMATLLLPVVGTICLVDALRTLRIAEFLRNCRPSAILAGQLAGAVAFLGLFAFLWCDLFATKRHYASLTPLDLPGSRLVRADVPTVQSYRALAEYLETNCDTFLISPGINSFYFWARKRPPTHLNVTTFSILTAEQEARFLAALNRARRPLIVVVEGTLTAVGRDNRPVIVASEETAPTAKASGPETSGPLRPFLRALRDDYVEIHRIPPFSIYGPKKD